MPKDLGFYPNFFSLVVPDKEWALGQAKRITDDPEGQERFARFLLGCQWTDWTGED